MKNFFYILVCLLLTSCKTSNTMYEKPKNLISKDSMVALLTDMYIASSVNNVKNKFLEKNQNYVFLVYDKYKIDSTRFSDSNIYYTSKTDEYTLMLKTVKFKLDSLQQFYQENDFLEQKLKDSLQKTPPNKKRLSKLIEKNENISLKNNQR